jgi:hypothetical protein
MRAKQGIPAEIRHLPNLLPEYGFKGGDPRRYQIKLVESDKRR